MEAVLGATTRRVLEVTHLGLAGLRVLEPLLCCCLELEQEKDPANTPSTLLPVDSNNKKPPSPPFFHYFLPWSKASRLDAQQSRASRLHCEPVLISRITHLTLEHEHAHVHAVSGASMPRLSQVDKLPSLSQRYAPVT